MMKPIILFFMCLPQTYTFGYDSGSDRAACGKPLRTSRQFNPPCDLNRENYCITAGTSYPWHAVKRFVKENQGLMKRMYGEQRHIAVLQAELESNDVNEMYKKYIRPHDNIRKESYRSEEKDETSPRLLQEDPKVEEILNTKFVYSEEATFKTNYNIPHFRPITTPKEDDLNFHKTYEPVTNDEIPLNTPSYENSTAIENVESTRDESLLENNTEAFTTDKLTTEKSTTEKITTEYSTTLTEKTTEEVSTAKAELKQETVGEVLFQDMDNQNKKAEKINFKLKGVNACPVKEEVVAPFWANNTRGEVLALLNLYPFEQYVHWEKCTFENRQMYCREGCKCEQQYRLHRLLAYDPNNECRGIFSDWFRFPSCCVCKCYNIPSDFRVTSRSPRNKYGRENEINDIPDWLFAKSHFLLDDEET